MRKYALSFAALLLASTLTGAEAQTLVNGQSAFALPTSVPSGITVTSTSLAANTSTQIAAANSNRIAYAIQCASGGVSVSETGAALSSAAVGSGSIFIPSGTAPYFTPPVTTQSALTAYTASAQTCVVTEYLR